MIWGTSQGCGVLLEKLPQAERRPATKGTRRVWVCWWLAITEQDPRKEEKGHFCWERPHQGEGGPLKSPSSCSCTGGENWKAEPFHHQRPAECPCPFSELQPLEQKVPGVEQEVLQGLTRGQPHPLPYAQPSLAGSRDPRRWGGWTAFPRIWPGAPTSVGARGQLLPSGTSQQIKGGQQKQFLLRTPSRGIWKVGDMEGMGTLYA